MSRKFLLPTIILVCLLIMTIGVRGYASSGEITAVSGSTPTIDGSINTVEWDDAAQVSFNSSTSSSNLTSIVYVKQDGKDLYVAFNISIPQDRQFVSLCWIAFDTSHDRSEHLQFDDLAVGIMFNGTLAEFNVVYNASGNPGYEYWWNPVNASGWYASLNRFANVCQVEFNITYNKINVVAGSEKTLGVLFQVQVGQDDALVDSCEWPWPKDSTYYYKEGHPSTWGNLTSAGYNWVPEFCSPVIASAFILTTPLAVIFYKRRRSI